MRLAGCVFVELVVGASLATGLGAGAWFGFDRLRDGNVAHAAAPVEQHPTPPGVALGPLQHAKPPRGLPESAYFLGARDAVLLAPLREGTITKVKFNRGGSSISLRVDFSNGARAAFKPDQSNEQTVPRREVAAYRLSRLLGLESVAPAIARRLPFKDLLEKLEPGSLDVAPRMRAEVLPDANGMVSGELSWWIPVIIDVGIDGVRIDEPEGINAWHRYLTIGESEPAADRQLLPQISNLLVFDYLTNNTDRFSGSNTKGSPDGRILYFMDNTLAFGVLPEAAPRVRQFLEYDQKFSRSLAAHLRALDEEHLRDEMTRDPGPYPQILSDAEIAGVLFRRDRVLTYLDGLIAQYGEAQVLVFPLSWRAALLLAAWVQVAAASESDGLLDEARQTLTIALGDPSPRVRRLAAAALSRVHDPQALAILEAALAPDAPPLARVDAAYALARAGDVRGSDALLVDLRAARREVRLAAARALARLGDARARERLRDVLDIPALRLAAAGDLAALGDAQGVAILRELLAGSAPEARLRAAVALGRAGDASGAAVLRELITSEASDLGAEDALARLGDRRAVPALERALGLSALRVEAAVDLRRLDVAVDPLPLAAALRRGDTFARISAAEATLVLLSPDPPAELRPAPH